MYARVIVDISHTQVDRVFEYKIPDGRISPAGNACEGSFGHMKDTEGIVIGLEASSEYAPEKIKEIFMLPSTIFAHRPANRSGLLNLLNRNEYNPRSGAFVLCFQHRSGGGRVSVKTQNVARLLLAEKTCWRRKPGC